MPSYTSTHPNQNLSTLIGASVPVSQRKTEENKQNEATIIHEEKKSFQAPTDEQSKPCAIGLSAFYTTKAIFVH